MTKKRTSGRRLRTITGEIPSEGNSLASYTVSLRDFFAAEALSALVDAFMSSESVWKDYNDLAESAFAIADAMVTQRGLRR